MLKQVADNQKRLRLNLSICDIKIHECMAYSRELSVITQENRLVFLNLHHLFVNTAKTAKEDCSFFATYINDDDVEVLAPSKAYSLYPELRS